MRRNFLKRECSFVRYFWRSAGELLLSSAVSWRQL